jgi:hypothetical protein
VANRAKLGWFFGTYYQYVAPTPGDSAGSDMLSARQPPAPERNREIVAFDDQRCRIDMGSCYPAEPIARVRVP